MAARSYKGVCYPDTASVVSQMYADSPIGPDVNGVVWTAQNTATFIDYATYSSLTFQFRNSLTAAISSQTIILLPCESRWSERVFDKYPLQDILFVSVLTIVSILGFVSGRMR
jgi:hypothetical protein